MTAPGWYNAAGDPPGTQRYWDGNGWVGEPVAVPAAPSGGSSSPANRVGRPAEASTRIWARVIDVVILFVFLFVLIQLDLGGAVDPFILENSDVQLSINGKALDTAVEYVVYVVFWFAWTVGWLHLKGATPGKLIMKVRVVDAVTGQTPLELQQATLRTANYVLPIIGAVSLSAGNIAGTVSLVIGVVSLIMLFTDDRRRTIMDHIGKTLVVDA